MQVLAIDQGSTESGYAIIDDKYNIEKTDKIDNYHLRMITLSLSRGEDVKFFTMEQIKSFGNKFGDSLIESIQWGGRFIEAWHHEHGRECDLIPRKTWVNEFTGNHLAKDKDVRMIVIDRYRDMAKTRPDMLGGGRTPIVGIKTRPGYLHGVADDAWQAIGLAMCWMDRWHAKCDKVEHLQSFLG